MTGSGIRLLPGCLFLCAWMALSPSAKASDVTVFAAASLTESLREAADVFERNGGLKVRLHLAASSLLARQIEAGAPADVLISADTAKMDALESAGLILRETRTRLLGNTLVIVVRMDDDRQFDFPADLGRPSIGRLALGETRTVPSGIYARRLLEERGLWEAVKSKVVPTGNVRAALAAVEAGNADAAIVYRTDALTSDKIRVARAIPEREGPVIRYPAAVLKSARHPEGGRAFLEFLGSDAARQVFRRHGFLIPEEGPDGENR